MNVPNRLENRADYSDKTMWGHHLFEWLLLGRSPLDLSGPPFDSLWRDRELLQLLCAFQEKLRATSLPTDWVDKFGLPQPSGASDSRNKSQQLPDLSQENQRKNLWRKEFAHQLRMYAASCPTEKGDIFEMLLELIGDLNSSPHQHSCLETFLSQFLYIDNELLYTEEVNQRIKRDSGIYVNMYILQRDEKNPEFLQSDEVLVSRGEPELPMAHWDFLIREIIYIQKAAQSWLKYRKHARRRIVNGIRKYWQMINLGNNALFEVDEAFAKRQSAWVAREVKKFWKQLGRILEHKIKLHFDKRRTNERAKHLDFLLHQTEKYSLMLSEGFSLISSHPKADLKDIVHPAASIQAASLNSSGPREKTEDAKVVPSFEQPLENHELSSPESPSISSKREFEQLSEESSDSSLQPAMQIQTRGGYDVSKRRKILPSEVAKRGSNFMETVEDSCSEKSLDPSGAEMDRYVPENGRDIPMTKIKTEVSRNDRDRSCGLHKRPQYRESSLQDLAEQFSDAHHESSSIGCQDTVGNVYHFNKSTLSNGSNTLTSFHEDKFPSSEGKPDHQAGKQKPTYERSFDDFVNKTINHAAMKARELQPTGSTLATANIKLRQPFLLKHNLREYQLVGLHWLTTMYERNLNGILADEMGLGKTIQTIALFAHLACEKAIWGPHLIIVPTGVMLNWEMEFKKWCPALKILTYFGTSKERKQKRSGWSKINAFHVCITSYKLVLQDHLVFRRKKWCYLVLDEAQHIKNFKSQRWQLLLHFNSSRRLLLTGTPLQNSLMELWSLMHFLMPHIFTSRQEFQEWFSSPVMDMIEGGNLVNENLIQRLHSILRPFILRRLKVEVEQQLPLKHEHLIICHLSKRQRYLYDEFMSRAQTRECLAGGNFFGIINCLMQLRKVCNHPDLFETRQVFSPFVMQSIIREVCNISYNQLQSFFVNSIPEYMLFLGQMKYSLLDVQLIEKLMHPINHIGLRRLPSIRNDSYILRKNAFLHGREEVSEIERSILLNDWNRKRSILSSEFTTDLIDMLTISKSEPYVQNEFHVMESLFSVSKTILGSDFAKILEVFLFVIQPVLAIFNLITDAQIGYYPYGWKQAGDSVENMSNRLLAIAGINQLLGFPDLRLIQYDCGKLQTLDKLLHSLNREGHRVLIFTQMSRMLDILEIFMNYHGFRYLRLDGSTRIELRQMLIEKFNSDNRIFAFILSTRSGGIGINLTGADTVIFYDSDWNPAMDAQAQDRCHRIGQTRDVHIYRLISEHTVEENILKKATQKRMMDELVIQGGEFNVEYFLHRNDWRDLFLAESDREQFPIDFTAQTNLTRSSPADLEKAFLEAEEVCDVEALNRAKHEIVEDSLEFQEDPSESAHRSSPVEDNIDLETKLPALELESLLSPIQRLALRLLERDVSIIEEQDINSSSKLHASRNLMGLAPEGRGSLIEELNVADDEDSNPESHGSLQFDGMSASVQESLSSEEDDAILE